MNRVFSPHKAHALCIFFFGFSFGFSFGLQIHIGVMDVDGMFARTSRPKLLQFRLDDSSQLTIKIALDGRKRSRPLKKGFHALIRMQSVVATSKKKQKKNKRKIWD